MTHLDLFAGIGGFSLAADWVWGKEYENVGHSEIEPYACKVYHRHFPESECLGDITKIRWRHGQADVITGGFPCQPHSLAGKRGASEDDRDLWSECARAVRMVRPKNAVFENVPGLLTSERGGFFNRVLSDLAEIGYDAEWYTIGAWQVGAPHKRDRIWIVAYPIGQRRANEQKGFSEPFQDEERIIEVKEQSGDIQQCRTVEPSFAHLDLADTSSKRLQRSSRGSIRIVHQTSGASTRRESCGRITETRGTWSVEPNVGRMANGVPSRVDRLKGLGNAIVPQLAAQIFQAIKETDDSSSPHQP